jgi:hypothetical protein
MPDKKMYGVAGNKMTTGFDQGEYLRVLAGSTGRVIYDKMRRSDPQIGAVLRAIMLPIRKAKYKVEAASEDEQDVAIAEQIESNILNGMTITWDDTLRHALLSLPFGFSILEKVWELRDGKAYLSKCDPRLPTSVVDSSQWKFDASGALVSIRQRGADGKYYDLPIEKLLVFTCDKEGDNWEGTSILRTAYKPWKIKDDLEKINVINHDRNGVGIPVAKMPQGCVPGSPEWEATADTLESLQANEKAYLQVPFGAEVDILNGNGKGTDTLASIKYYDEAIARTMLAQFINLGTTETGSRALGASFIDVFLDSLQAYAGYICEVFNRFLIREYVDYNWQVKEYPKLTCGSIKTLDTATLDALAQAKLLTPDFELENSIRAQLNLPEKKVKEIQPPMPPVVPQAPTPQSATQVQEQAPEDQGNLDQVAASDVRLSTKAEDFPGVDFAGMEIRLNTAADDYGRRMLQIWEAQRADVVTQLVAGKEVQNIRVIRKKDQYDLLMEAYREQAREGGQDVRRELEKQGFALAAKKTPSVQTYEEMYSAYAKIQIEGAATKLVSTLALETANRIGQNLDDSDLQKALDKTNISDQTWLAMVNGAVNSGWGDGREETASDYQDEIDHCIYTSVMDQSTCFRCSRLDGVTHEFGDTQYETPNPDCAGRDWCRCMTVYVMKAEKEKPKKDNKGGAA